MKKGRIIAQLLIDMPAGDLPLALGVLYCDPMPTFDAAMAALNRKAAAGRTRDLESLLRSGETWSIGEDVSSQPQMT